MKMVALVVDDSRVQRRIIGGYLKELNFDVLEADHGQSAMEVLNKNSKIDVIFLDWQMPVMSGIEFLHAMRNDPRFKAIKVCMVTAESDQSCIIKALEEGADEYVMKPFCRETLEQKLELVTRQNDSAAN